MASWTACMTSGGLGCSVATPMSQARWATALATQAEISLQSAKCTPQPSPLLSLWGS